MAEEYVAGRTARQMAESRAWSVAEKNAWTVLSAARDTAMPEM
ncbi:hypothetical protein [Streptomyces geranii]|nr:hypothetical protein [Streptomyces geranii]